MKARERVALTLVVALVARSQLAGQAVDARALVAAPRNSGRLGSVTASSDVGTPTVRAFASLAYLPVVRLRAQQNPTFAFGSDMGLSVAPSRSPVTVSLSYRIERFRFSSATGRSEQFEALSLSAGVRAW